MKFQGVQYLLLTMNISIKLAFRDALPPLDLLPRYVLIYMYLFYWLFM